MMGVDNQDQKIKQKAADIWSIILSLSEVPIYPAIVQEMQITAREEEYFDRDLSYEEKYTEWLDLRAGLIVAVTETKSNLLGIGDAIILDIQKHVLLRAPRVKRCGLVLPLIYARGYLAQPRDYVEYFQAIMEKIEAYQQSAIKKSLR